MALFLEESGLPYDMVPVDTARGEQHSAAYRAINPNGKTPALVDGDAGWTDYPNVKRFFDLVNARPAAQRAEALKDAHKFKLEYDQETLDALYPQNVGVAA